MKKIEEHRCFNGTVSVWEHASSALNCTMQFSVFLPPQAKDRQVPWLTFLSGLTCTHENFTTKAGAYQNAAEKGLAIIAPDTSPRGDHVPDDADAWDFGQGAGFYINATQAPWAEHYQMEGYIADELNQLVCNTFPVLKHKQGLMGHSMGGHGALTLYLKYKSQYLSASAFAPIVNPSAIPWGQKIFHSYLGANAEEWVKHDASLLMLNERQRASYPEILVDQGLDDPFQEQLQQSVYAQACEQAGQKLRLREHPGYDHGYYFIQSFIADHIHHHASILEAI